MTHIAHGLQGIVKYNNFFICWHFILFFSPYKLSVNENLSKIELLNDQESQEYEKLKNLPIREPTDYYVLEDIKSSEQILNDKYVNLLFAIREVRLALLILKI